MSNKTTLAKAKMLKPQTKQSFTTYIMVIAAFVIMMVLSSTGNVSSQIEGLLVPLCVYSILAVSLNLTVGILGELSLGQAGFMCVGAYASALFSIATNESITVAWIRFPLAILVGGICAAVFGILIGIPVLRLRGDYLAIVTLAFGEIIKNVFAALYVGIDSNGLHIALNQADMNLAEDGTEIIRGALGVKGVPQDSTFVIGFVLLMITLIISYNFINSRTGRAVKAIRDNAIAAESVGLNITKYKLITFALTAFLAGLAGALYAPVMAVSPILGDSFIIQAFTTVVVGGGNPLIGTFLSGTVLGVISGIVSLEQGQFIGKIAMLVAAIICIRVLPGGFSGLVEKIRKGV